MAHIARPDLAFGRMAAVAIVVGLEADRDRLGRTGTLVAGSAAGRWAARTAVVIPVVEFDVEALTKAGGEIFYRRRFRLQVAVADRAHYLVALHQRFVRELIQMAADARLMPGELQVEGTPLALMAGGAFELFVLGDPVRKGFKRLVRCFSRDRFGRFGGSQRRRRFRRLIQATRDETRDRDDDEREFEYGFCVEVLGHASNHKIVRTSPGE